MHEYDIALKGVLMPRGGSAIAAITGFAVTRWINVELAEVRSPRVDMLGETGEGNLVHIELQSTNDADMALRMAEYSLAIYRKFRRFPSQVVLYVGEAPMRMPSHLAGAGVSFQYRLVDIRELDGEALLASEHLEDNIVALLMRLGNERSAVRRILRHISQKEPSLRGAALRELTILAGLRSLGETIRQETTRMPILSDIMDHDLFGPAIRQGREEGLEHERHILSRQMTVRFGSVPAWAQERIKSLSSLEVEDVAVRLLSAADIDELLN